MRLQRRCARVLVQLALCGAVLVGPAFALGRSLPPFAGVSKLEIRTPYLPALELSDPAAIERAVAFINAHGDGWNVPWSGPPVAEIEVQLCKGPEWLGGFGVNPTFLTRNVREFWSRPVQEGEVRELLAALHPGLVESLAPKVPEDPKPEEQPSYWKERLERELPPGTTRADLEAYLRSGGLAFDDVQVGGTVFVNAAVQVVSRGAFVDTVIRAQFILDDKASLRSIRMLGYELASKLPLKRERVPKAPCK